MQICNSSSSSGSATEATTIADDADGGACHMTGSGAIRCNAGGGRQHVCVEKGEGNAAIAIINQFSQ